MAEPDSVGRRSDLDALRGVAALIVFVFHVDELLLPGGGWIGVTAFFTLSGYLITSLLLAEADSAGRVAVRAFYVRRARRLLPAFAFFLAVAATYAMAIGHRTVEAIPYAALYLGNLRSNAEMGFLTHTWSLAVEEHFYVVWPLVFVLARRRGWLLRATVGLLLASFAWRVALVVDGADWERVGRLSDVRAESVLIGCALAVWVARGRSVAGSPARWVSVALPFLLLAPATHAGLVAVVGFPVVAVATAGFIATSPGGGPSWLAWFGRLTYGFYLWHVLVLWVLKSHTPLGVLGLLIVGFAVTMAVTLVSWHLVERRWLRASGDRVRVVVDGVVDLDVEVDQRWGGRVLHGHDRADVVG